MTAAREEDGDVTVVGAGGLVGHGVAVVDPRDMVAVVEATAVRWVGMGAGKIFPGTVVMALRRDQRRTRWLIWAVQHATCLGRHGRSDHVPAGCRAAAGVRDDAVVVPGVPVQGADDGVRVAQCHCASPCCRSDSADGWARREGPCCRGRGPG